jgi:hypothetical protein
VEVTLKIDSKESRNGGDDSVNILTPMILLSLLLQTTISKHLLLRDKEAIHSDDVDMFF